MRQYWTAGQHRHLPNLQFLLIMLLMILLNSCSHLHKSDGPPNYNVDVSGIPNAVPKPEPLAKYGNYKSYIVFGKRYYTLRSSHQYNQIGTASWYGTKFHARKTSSGERYDMLGMTAAHKSLPLPTYVEVTNLRNNRTIIVKVNDRGPFAANRIIDLSYVAAKKLDMLAHGTAPVRVRAINPYRYNREPFFVDSRPLKSRPVFAQNSRPAEMVYPKFHPTYQHSKPVFLQVGAFRSKRYAVRLQRRIKVLSRAPVQVMNPSSKGRLYRVKIGPFRDMASLTKITSQLKGLGMTPNKIYG